MKKILLFLLLCGSLFAGERIQYTIIKNPYAFSTYFELLRPDGYEGRVIKNAISVRSIYDLHDEEGVYEGQGICRLFSLGLLFSWARDIDIYDAEGESIGLICGRVWSGSKAKFEIYDVDENLVAIAYYNRNRSGFSLMKNGKVESLAGYLKRNPAFQSTDWDLMLYDNSLMDRRILKIFSAFISDYQDTY